jgi:hypothetical protein
MTKKEQKVRDLEFIKEVARDRGFGRVFSDEDAERCYKVAKRAGVLKSEEFYYWLKEYFNN